MLSTKDASGMVESLDPIVDHWIATQPDVFGKPETPAEELLGIIKEQNQDANVDLKSNITEAVDFAISQANPGDLILITGSLYMVGAARDRWFPQEDLLRSLEDL